ncbi:MAG: hypothetical protein ACE5HC_16830 [Candidatus Binatia bacterium]
MTKEEIEGHHSLHNSGTLILPTKTGGKRQRHIVIRPSDYQGPIPLVAILPMEITRYRVAQRRPNKGDLVLDVSSLLSQPFGLLFFLKRSSADDPPVVQPKDDWPIYARAETPLADFRLCVPLYSNPSTFRRWQELEVEVTSQPSAPGKELTWPVFSAS